MMKLGISPIGWSNDDIPELGESISLRQCIEEMAEAGYEGCEIGYKFPKAPKDLLELLAPYGLKVCGQWFDYKLCTESLDSNLERLKPQLEYLQAVGCKIIGGGEKGRSCIFGAAESVLQYNSPLEEDAYKRYGENLTHCGEIASTYDIALAFHHHIGTIVSTLEETRWLLDYSDPEYVGLNYDTAHAYVGGTPPLEFLNEVKDRILHVHLKNVRPKIMTKVNSNHWSFLQSIRSGLFTVPGDKSGGIEFGPILNLLQEEEYSEWLVVEADQDPILNNPLDMAQTAYKYLKKMVLSYF